MAAFNKKIAGQARNDRPLAPLDYLKLVHMGRIPYNQMRAMTQINSLRLRKRPRCACFNHTQTALS